MTSITLRSIEATRILFAWLNCTDGHVSALRSIRATCYWEHTIRGDREFEKHVDYIHWNPVKHGHVAHVADWPYSRFHRFVAKGVYPLDWVGNHAGDNDGCFGE